jgi:uncharacterized protein
MKIKSIFVNLPIKDVKRTREFWTNLGFSFNEQFSDDRALCLVLNDGLMYSMLITHEMFSTFTNKPIADGTTSQVLNALEVDSREQVDKIVKLALENGATRYRESQDHGWMYYDSFADLDGHQWEIMCTDLTQMTPKVELEKIIVKATISIDKQKVWDYYTQPKHITKWNFANESWHCPTATNDMRVGGKYSARMEAKDGSFGFDFDATYQEINHGHSFTYEFGGRLATVDFKEQNGQTEVTISFDPETENSIELQQNGWQAILDNFKKYIEAN